MLYFVIMNVKKIKLRNDVLSYLVDNPSSEVKEIASHVGVTKQALYYHLKILLKENKIQIVETSIVNGIEKRFYSVVADEVENNQKIDSTGENEQKTGISDQITSEKHKDADEDSVARSEGAKEEESNEQPTVDTSTIFSEQDEEKTDHIVEDRIDSEENKYSRFKGIFKSLTFKRGDKDTPQGGKPDDENNSTSYKEEFNNLVVNLKSLGLFNQDSYDLMGSTTALFTSDNQLISFNNRKQSNFNVNSLNKDFSPSKDFKKNDRLIIIDESFIDSHEIIKSPLKKPADQENFIARFIQKKYSIKPDDLTFTYEVFKTKEKNMIELNILFSQKKYLSKTKEISKKFPNKDKFFLSIAGLVSHYNALVTEKKTKAVNMYLFLGKKACEVTWIYGKRILFNRSILISNQDLDIDAYLRESLPRLVNTIGVSRNQLKKDGVIGDNPDNIFLFGPNASQDLCNYFKEKFNLDVNFINVKYSELFKNNNFNSSYLSTSGLIKEAVKKWGRFRYVYPQNTKKALRKAGRANIINMFMIISSILLTMGNIKVYENLSIKKFDQKQSISSYNTTLKLIETFQNAIDEKENEIQINGYLSGIKNNRKKIFKTFSILNSDLFTTISFKNLSISNENLTINKMAKFEVIIKGDIIDERPEAILEAQRVREELSLNNDIIDGEIIFSNYIKDRLPVEIKISI